jgi:hypothetical protein
MVRIITVATQLVMMLAFHLLLRLEQFAGLPDAMYVPITVQRIFMLPFGWEARPSVDILVGVYYATIFAGILALVGLTTRMSLIAFALGNIFMTSYLYSFGDYHHPEAPLFLAFAILAMSPAGHALSVDAAVRRRSGQAIDAKGPMAGWPILLIQWLFVLIYLSAVLSKVVFHEDWLNGYTLQYYLIGESLKNETLLGLWFSRHHLWVMVSQYLVVAFQGTFVLAMLFPKLKWIYVPMGLVFHIANILFLGASFPQWLALFPAVFIPWHHVLAWMRGRWAPTTGQDPAPA